MTTLSGPLIFDHYEDAIMVPKIFLPGYRQSGMFSSGVGRIDDQSCDFVSEMRQTLSAFDTPASV
ncbi:MAG: hypothetical protein IMF06_07640 [Proteobacteria bacterium]|nr:hypothetical protein [Pseudomonadota bacterium]